MRAGDGGKQVGSEGGDAALARQMVADKSDLADFGIFFHMIFMSLDPFGPDDEPVGRRADEVERIASDQSEDLIPVRDPAPRHRLD